MAQHAVLRQTEKAVLFIGDMTSDAGGLCNVTTKRVRRNNDVCCHESVMFAMA
jgi:hypothetical protein